MKTTNFSVLNAQELSNAKTVEVGKQASQALKNIKPFYFINQLNKLAAKNEYVDEVSIKELQTRCKRVLVACGYKNIRYGFDACLLTKDFANRFCTINKADANTAILNDLQHSDVVLVNGCEVRLTGDDEVVIYKPIARNLNSFMRAFERVVRAFEREEEEKQKAAAKAAKAAAKAAAKEEKDAKAAKAAKDKQVALIVDMWRNGQITGDEMQARITAIDIAV